MRFILLFFVSWLGIPAASAVGQESLTLIGATVIDGTDSAPVTNAVINIVDGRIASLGPRSTTEPSAGARRIDVSGEWVLPGLIDAHMHFSQSAGLYTRPDAIDLRSRRSYQAEQTWIQQRLPYTLTRYLCSGITSVADVGGGYWTLKLRGPDTAPRIWAAGPLVSTYVPDQLLDTSDPSFAKVASVSEARSAVRRIAEKSPDYIKLWMIDTGNWSRDLPIYRAAAEQAHALGLRVFVHATELQTAKLALGIGADVLVHAVQDRLVDDELIAKLRERDTITVSTLAVVEGYRRVLSRTAEVTPFMRQCGDPEVIATWSELPAGMEQPAGEASSFASRNVKRLLDACLRVAAGDDAGNIGTLHGPGLHRELELLGDAGFTPAQVITAATATAAQVLRPSPDVGTLAPGKSADLLIVKANPLAAIGNLRQIDRVLVGGRVVWPAASDHFTFEKKTKSRKDSVIRSKR